MQLLRQRLPLSEDAFAEVVVWRVPNRLQGSEHAFKYRLAYKFESLEKLLDDFWEHVDTLRGAL
ncbi:hypothetical protein MNBD_GAMMA13-2036 [hydrothermal vent metagenome]|uniref:Uncharacterized protein n=1 Tax=hydrothermal vent metagenome TaxID=652676 RepID=A0A3B0YYJ0_9ZZZZ